MSVKAVSAVLHGMLESSGVDPSEKLVMLILAEHARVGSDLAFPSTSTIARLACMKPTSRRFVLSILQKMVRDGWLSVEQASKGGAGAMNTTVYRLNIARMKESQARAELELEAQRNAKKCASHSTLNSASHSTLQPLGSVLDGALKCASERGKCAADEGLSVLPTAHEPVDPFKSTGFEPDARAPATPGETSTPIEIQQIEPERHESRRTPSGDLTAEEQERRKQDQRRIREMAEQLASSKAMR